MKRKYKILYLLLTVLICSCTKRDCPRKISNMKIFPVNKIPNNEPSYVTGWFHNEFQYDKLNFTLEFDHTGAGEMCKYFWDNHPDNNSIQIKSNKIFYVNNDTLYPGEELNGIFNITETPNENFFLSYLISQKTDKEIKLLETYCDLFANLTTSKGEKLIDSCTIKVK